MSFFFIWIFLLFLLPIISLVIILKRKQRPYKIGSNARKEKAIVCETNRAIDYKKKEYERLICEIEHLKEKENTIEREELISYVDEKLSVYMQMKDIYSKWYNTSIVTLGTTTPKVLSQEVSDLVSRMNETLEKYNEITNKLQDSKEKSLEDMKEAITFSCDSADGIMEEMNIMASQASSLSLRWKFLSDEDKNDLGNLRKL
jgi:hypothetical protein